MIALLPVPDYVGQAPASANVGALRNRGLELALNYRKRGRQASVQRRRQLHQNQ